MTLFQNTSTVLTDEQLLNVQSSNQLIKGGWVGFTEKKIFSAIYLLFSFCPINFPARSAHAGYIGT